MRQIDIIEKYQRIYDIVVNHGGLIDCNRMLMRDSGDVFEGNYKRYIIGRFYSDAEMDKCLDAFIADSIISIVDVELINPDYHEIQIRLS